MDLSLPSRIAMIYDSCNEKEKYYLRCILQELADDGYSKTYEDIWLSDYKEIPVDIDTFIESDLYLGRTNRNGKSVYPFWRKTLRDIFQAGNKYEECFFTGATRIGKSSTAITGTAYMLYKLMCLRNPQQYYGKKDVSKFSVLFFNITKDQAKDVGFREFNDTLKATDWFNQHGKFSRSENDFFYIPEGDKIVVDFGSSGQNALGKQVFVGFCLVGSTNVVTSAGVHTLEELYSSDNSNVLVASSAGYQKFEDVKLTKYVTDTVRITLDDGTVIEGTPEHCIMLSNGEYKMLKDLTEDDDIMEQPIEEWRDISGYEGLYQISNFGRVKRLAHVTIGKNGRSFPFKERIMNLSENGDGYLEATLSNGSSKSFSVHRLVASAFVENPFNKACVNHKDGNKKNNLFSNLEWCTSLENTQHFRTAECFASARIVHARLQSLSHKGQTHTVSEETRQKLSIANRRENLSPERRRKISEGLMGRVLSPSSRAKIGAKNAVSQCGKLFVNDGESERRITQAELEKLLSEGWIRGRLKRIWITNGTEDKYVLNNDSLVLPDGWRFGRVQGVGH